MAKISSWKSNQLDLDMFGHQVGVCHNVGATMVIISIKWVYKKVSNTLSNFKDNAGLTFEAS